MIRRMSLMLYSCKEIRIVRCSILCPSPNPRGQSLPFSPFSFWWSGWSASKRGEGERRERRRNQRGERKQHTHSRKGWEDGTPPAHRDFTERKELLAAPPPFLSERGRFFYWQAANREGRRVVRPRDTSRQASGMRSGPAHIHNHVSSSISSGRG